MKNLIDTHFHLDHYRNYLEIAKRISELKQYTICVTNSPGIFLSCKNMIPETRYLKFAIGLHPFETGLGLDDYKDLVLLLNKTNYVGEIGLDFTNRAHMDKNTQIQIFDKIVALCALENKLLTVHIRKAETEAIKIIKKHSPKKCIIHWFTGTERQMNELLELGCYFSVNTNMVASANNSKYLRIPTKRILVESDGPYTKVFGKKYIPESLQQTYELISEFYKLPDFTDTVYSNFQNILEA